MQVGGASLTFPSAINTGIILIMELDDDGDVIQIRLVPLQVKSDESARDGPVVEQVTSMRGDVNVLQVEKAFVFDTNSIGSSREAVTIFHARLAIDDPTVFVTCKAFNDNDEYLKELAWQTRLGKRGTLSPVVEVLYAGSIRAMDYRTLMDRTNSSGINTRGFQDLDYLPLIVMTRYDQNVVSDPELLVTPMGMQSFALAHLNLKYAGVIENVEQAARIATIYPIFRILEAADEMQLDLLSFGADGMGYTHGDMEVRNFYLDIDSATGKIDAKIGDFGKIKQLRFAAVADSFISGPARGIVGMINRYKARNIALSPVLQDDASLTLAIDACLDVLNDVRDQRLPDGTQGRIAGGSDTPANSGMALDALCAPGATVMVNSRLGHLFYSDQNFASSAHADILRPIINNNIGRWHSGGHPNEHEHVAILSATSGFYAIGKEYANNPAVVALVSSLCNK